MRYTKHKHEHPVPFQDLNLIEIEPKLYVLDKPCGIPVILESHKTLKMLC